MSIFNSVKKFKLEIYDYDLFRAFFLPYGQDPFEICKHGERFGFDIDALVEQKRINSEWQELRKWYLPRRKICLFRGLSKCPYKNLKNLLAHGNDTHSFDLRNHDDDNYDQEIFDDLKLYPKDFIWTSRNHQYMWHDFADSQWSSKFCPKVVIYNNRKIKPVNNKHWAKEGIHILRPKTNSFKDALLAFVTLRAKGKDGKWLQEI